MRIGYNTWSMASVPYSDFIPGLADIGFRALAISVVQGYTIGGQWVENATALHSLSKDDRRTIKAGLRERDLELTSIVANQSLVNGDPNALDFLKRATDLCIDLATGDELPTLNTGTGGASGDLDALSKGSMISVISKCSAFPWRKASPAS
jgi:sugar phosphate isomerase/epimerase